MSTLYLRGTTWWIAWGSGPGRMQKSTGKRDRAEAEEVQREVDEQLRLRALVANAAGEKPHSFRAWRKWWIEKLEQRGAASAGHKRNHLKHAAEFLDGLDMKAVRPRHIRDLVETLKTRGELAPRSIHHIYGTVHTLFEEARADEVVPYNPVVLPKGVLPMKRDKDPRFRRRSVFTREELGLLLSSPLVPEDRRVYYALLFLTGMRSGEACERRWRDLEERKPLPCLHVPTAWDSRRRKVKSTKTDDPREVPVHPALKAILARWKLGGWARSQGRAPEPDDLLCPSRAGTRRDPRGALKRLKYDLAQLGLLGRRVHDSRRTFISLCLADGARREILKWVTHGRPRAIIDDYTTLPWETLCEAVSCLRIPVADSAATAAKPSRKTGRK